MKRRGNKSKKVPGVRLRPAQEGAYARITQSESCWAQDTQAGSDDTSVLDLCPRPFKNVVVCATGILDKTTLFKQALELGATSVTAFTDRVTHLIAEEHGGAKYNCAIERNIPILQPSWITECYKIWLKGDDVDIATSIVKHHLPIFSGVIICPSGIQDITRRTQIHKLTVKHGGHYVMEMTRPIKITHLLCSGDEETDKMRYAEKFKSRGEADIQLVWEEWFWDCLDFGSRFDETKYNVRRPRPERKAATKESRSPPSILTGGAHGDKSSEVATVKTSAQIHPSETHNDFEDEPADVKIIPSVTLQLWGSLLERRGYHVAGGELICSPTKPQCNALIPKVPDSPTRSSGFRRSVISSFRRSNSFAPMENVRSGGHRPLPFRRATTSAFVFTPPDLGGEENAAGPSRIRKVVPVPDVQVQPEADIDQLSESPCVNIFSGLRFRVLGEAKSQLVREAIENRGGRISMEDEDNVDYIVVRLVSGSKIFRQETDEAMRSKYRTECWLERCIFEDRVCAVDDHPSFAPLGFETPVPGAEKILMSISGFDQSEVCGIKRLLRALGINMVQYFSRKSTHLLCQSGCGLKYEKACEWGIPVVTVDWLIAIVKSSNDDCIPSSRSPSPMKLVSSSSRTPLSPIKIDSEAVKALHNSITSLLGKRQNSETAEENLGTAGGKTKRPRPKRAKVPARNASCGKDSDLPIQSISSIQPISVFASSSANAFDTYDDVEEGTVDTSIRVVYEDPGQREEKRRLMSLLKPQNDGSVLEESVRVGSEKMRRSTRIAGV